LRNFKRTAKRADGQEALNPVVVIRLSFGTRIRWPLNGDAAFCPDLLLSLNLLPEFWKLCKRYLIGQGTILRNGATIGLKAICA
jgi:hypothetical protein